MTWFAVVLASRPHPAPRARLRCRWCGGPSRHRACCARCRAELSAHWEPDLR